MLPAVQNPEASGLVVTAAHVSLAIGDGELKIELLAHVHSEESLRLLCDCGAKILGEVKVGLGH